MGQPSCARVAILAFGLLVFGMGGLAGAAGKNATGTWKFFVGPRPADDRLGTLELKQERDKLTGMATVPGGKSVEIQDGKVTEEGIFFVIQPGPNGPKIYHKGKIDGDTIKGKTEIMRPGKPKQSHFDWEAQRAPNRLVTRSPVDSPNTFRAQMVNHNSSDALNAPQVEWEVQPGSLTLYVLDRPW